MSNFLVVSLLIILTFLISATIGFIIVPRIVFISKVKKLFDFVDKRKVHTQPIPRLGGVSFLPALLFSVSFVMALRYSFHAEIPENLSESVLLEMLFLICGFVVLYFIGLADDLVSVNFKYKLMGQVMASVLIIMSGVYVNNFHGFLGIYAVPDIVGYIVTIVLVCFVINAINLIDGIDGLASGLSSIALFSLGIWFWSISLFSYAMLAFAMLGVIVPFFVYNVFGTNLKIFMGDTGSLLIGFLIAFLSAKLCMVSLTINLPYFYSPPIFVFSILFIPLFDAARVFIERMRQGKSPFHPDKTHIHHKFLALGFSHRQTMVIILVIASLIIAVNYLLSIFLSINYLFLINVLLGLAMMFILHRIRVRMDDEVQNDELEAQSEVFWKRLFESVKSIF